MEYQCDTCKKWFPSPGWLKTHHRIYPEAGPHEDKEKDSLVEWLELNTGRWNEKEDFFEVKEWIENIDPHDPEYKHIAINFMNFGVDMNLLKDTTFERKDINTLVTAHNSKLDELYIYKIWEKILVVRSIAQFTPPAGTFHTNRQRKFSR